MGPLISHPSETPVYKATAVGESEEVYKYAIMEVDQTEFGPWSRERLEAELTVLRTTNHNNVVKYVGTFYDSRDILCELDV